MGQAKGAQDVFNVQTRSMWRGSAGGVGKKGASDYSCPSLDAPQERVHSQRSPW